eukprot:518204-Prorocentrum_lima.AAC.1
MNAKVKNPVGANGVSRRTCAGGTVKRALMGKHHQTGPSRPGSWDKESLSTSFCHHYVMKRGRTRGLSLLVLLASSA